MFAKGSLLHRRQLKEAKNFTVKGIVHFFKIESTVNLIKEKYRSQKSSGTPTEEETENETMVERR